MPVTYQIVFSVLLGFVSYCVNADGFEFKSGKQQANLIELFTSQGCSSCPPAEQYLNSLKNHELLWKSYIPLAFHVDYWDYLGWKDSFAKPDHRVRQEAYAKLNKQRTIYTPGFYVNGAPWRRGIFERDPPLTQTETGILSVRLHNDQLTAEYRPLTPVNEVLTLNVAIVGMDLQTDIKAGENSGRHSNHEFVVLHQQILQSSDGFWQLQLAQIHFAETKNLALIAWINTKGSPRPLQAVGGYIKTD